MNQKNQIMDQAGFDSWAPVYDETVRQSDAENSYPFAAYSQVMAEVHRQVKEVPGKQILDMGIGTGTYTAKLYDQGYDITGVDFSAEMLKKAKAKMPNARLIRFDFQGDLPPELLADRFDAIIFSYSIHHLTRAKQVTVLARLRSLLNEGGRMIIGDVMTQTEAQMEAARVKDRDIWDFAESYLVVEELLDRLPGVDASFYPKSYCSGVLVMI